MATIPSRKVPISLLESVIAAAQERNYDYICIGQINGDIVVGKDVGPENGPRELEGDSISAVGESISV